MNKIKNGFSMVELLFVMAIMAALAAIAIPSLSGASNSAIMSSMKSDIQGVSTTLLSEYANDPDYTNIVGAIGSDVVFADATGNGLSDTGLLTNKQFSISKDNVVTIKPTSTSCTQITVTNPTLSTKKVLFNNCTDGKIQVI